jgi:hypothetical protein
MKLPHFFIVFVNVYIRFRIRQKFRILADPDPDPQHCRYRYSLMTTNKKNKVLVPLSVVGTRYR